MGLLGRLPKNGAAAPNAGTSDGNGPPIVPADAVTVPTVGTQFQLNNVPQLVNRLNLSTNTKTKVQQSIALRLAEGGDTDVLANMQSEMTKFRDFRNNTLNAFAAQGQEPPPELLTRLDDLEELTGTRITFQSMRNQERSQLSSVFNPQEMLKRETDTLIEIEDFVRPVTTAKMQEEFRTGLLKNAQDAVTLRRTAQAGEIEGRNAARVEAVNTLDAIYPTVTGKQINNIMQSRVYRNLGISAADAGEWARNKLKAAETTRKLDAEIASKRSTASTQRVTNAQKARQLRIDAILGSKSDAELRSGGEILSSQGGIDPNYPRLGINATDYTKALETRLKAGSTNTDYLAAIQESELSQFEINTVVGDNEAVTQWTTGDTSNALSAQVSLKLQEDEQRIMASLPPGGQRETQLAKLRKGYAEVLKPLAEDHNDGLIASLPDYERPLVDEFRRKGSINLTSNTTKLIANDPYFAALVPSDSPFKPEAELFLGMVERFESENSDLVEDSLGGTANPFNFEESDASVTEFLTSDFTTGEGEVVLGPDGQPMTNALVLRRAHHGSMQAAATFFKAQSLYKDEVGLAVMGGKNTEGVPMFSPTGQISPEFRTDDFEVNYLQIMLEMHAANQNNGLSEVSSSVARFITAVNAETSRLGNDVEGDEALEAAYALTTHSLMPQRKEEAVMGAITGGNLSRPVVDENGKISNFQLSAAQDINYSITGDMRESVLLAFDEYKYQIGLIDDKSKNIRLRTLVNEEENAAKGIPQDFQVTEKNVKDSHEKELANLIKESKKWSPNAPSRRNGQ